MKQLLMVLFVLMMAMPYFSSAQVVVSTDTIKKDTIVSKGLSTDSDSVYTAVEFMPSFPGGDDGRLKFLEENLVYPKKAWKKGIQGRVFTTFIVEKDGSISNVKVLRGIGGGCDEEAVRVVKLMPKWEPGMQNRKPARVRINMPIKFTLAQTRTK